MVLRHLLDLVFHLLELLLVGGRRFPNRLQEVVQGGLSISWDAIHVSQPFIDLPDVFHRKRLAGRLITAQRQLALADLQTQLARSVVVVLTPLVAPMPSSSEKQFPTSTSQGWPAELNKHSVTPSQWSGLLQSVSPGGAASRLAPGNLTTEAGRKIALGSPAADRQA
ncbi:MAG TPA: hypothetical protein P5555_10810 [Candidatus Paceibacterota bacterium]|nr:hypothetical protein [Candidatus Paceibacterota bacterium]